MANTPDFDAYINRIQTIRSENNGNWMDLLRLAFKHDPKGAAAIMARIFRDDARISGVVAELVEAANRGEAE